MRFHIVKLGEDKEAIARLYKMNLEDMYKLNPTINNRELIVGEKIRVEEKDDTIEEISNLYTNSHDDVNGEEKYICPHCKNIIIIPKR